MGSVVDVLHSKRLTRSKSELRTIPQVCSSTEGVSVDYAFDEDKQWFVFRASYGRNDKAADMLIEAGVYAYVVKRYEWKNVAGRRKRELVNLIPGLLFAYLTPGDAEMFVRGINLEDTKNPCPKLSAIISYYYNHFHTNDYGYNPPLTVGDGEMRNLILGTWSHNEKIVVLKSSQYRFKSNDVVRVTKGPFKGVCGKVVRAAGQQRVLIRLSNPRTGKVVGEFGTAYIPSAFMKKVEDCEMDEGQETAEAENPV